MIREGEDEAAEEEEEDDGLMPGDKNSEGSSDEEVDDLVRADAREVMEDNGESSDATK